MKNILVILLIAFSLLSCEIREEYTFQKDGSGVYEMVLDFSDFMKMKEENDSTLFDQKIDTIIDFAVLLEEKRDSIAQLSEEEQARLESLRPLKFEMKVNDTTKQMLMNLRFDFDDIRELEKFAETIEKANIKALDELSETDETQPNSMSDSLQPTNSGLFEMASSFHTEFSSKKFSRKITDKAREEALKTKDTTMASDDPFADMLKFRQVFRFPYRVRAVDNEKARILSDFKGIELEVNMYDLNNDPDVFNVEVLFEK
jgi:vacuolar-type H+-ATPase subunit I/STV1